MSTLECIIAFRLLSKLVVISHTITWESSADAVKSHEYRENFVQSAKGKGSKALMTEAIVPSAEFDDSVVTIFIWRNW
jgi:hypothetical protein